MDPVAALEQLGGYATRAALLRLGVARRALAASVLQGTVLRLRRGVYALGLPDGLDHLRGAAIVLAGVVSHDSAAVLWGLELAHRPTPTVTVSRDRSRAHYDGVRVRRADVAETVVRDGLRVTSVIRTVLDCAADLPLDEAIVIADSALRAGLTTKRELVSAARAVHGPHARRVRKVARLADERSGSVLESLLRVLLTEAGLAPDQSQFTVRDERGRPVGRFDFVYLRARLIVEADGFEFHSGRADYRKDRRRGNACCRADWSLLRFSWEDVRLYPEYVVEMVRYELAKPSRRHRAARVPARTQKAA